MIIFNKEKVTHILITDLIKSEFIWYDEVEDERGFFGLILVKEGYKAGFYSGEPTSLFSSRFTEVKEGILNIDGVLHFKPVIKIYINDERVGMKYFDTIEQAESFCKVEFPNVDYEL